MYFQNFRLLSNRPFLNFLGLDPIVFDNFGREIFYESKLPRFIEAEVQQYHDNGWIGPLTLISELEMAEFRKRLDIEIFEPALESKIDEKNFCHNRHLDNSTVYQLLTHPNLAKKAESILGPDIVLWRSNFQLKLPLGQQDDWDTGVPWHQDSAYFNLHPMSYYLLG